MLFLLEYQRKLPKRNRGSGHGFFSGKGRAKGNFTEIREFNLMFKTFQGVTEDAKNTVYLRPETAQGIFVNFKNVQRTSRKKVPFGIGQIGKSFRNEITPGNFTFRTREFEQMELEFFCEPDTDLSGLHTGRSSALTG